MEAIAVEELCFSLHPTRYRNTAAPAQEEEGGGDFQCRKKFLTPSSLLLLSSPTNLPPALRVLFSSRCWVSFHCGSASPPHLVMVSVKATL